MSIAVVARGRVVSIPVEISSERGPLVSFMLGDAQFGIAQDVEYQVEDLPVVEVNCRGDSFAARVLDRLELDAYVVVVGSARISQPLERYGNHDLVLIAIEADTVGVDLARAG